MIVKNWIKRRKNQRAVFGALLLIIVALLRLPWIDCDAGSPSLWTYGSFLTDEGYYTAGGRQAYLGHDFVSASTREGYTFYTCPMMHLEAFASYKLFGLTTWAHRVPFVLGAILAWLAVYWMAARKTVPWLAFATTLIVSCNPYSLVYERTASSDIAMGSLVVFACFLLLRRKSMFTVLSGILFALACQCKFSAIAFVPMFLALAWPSRKKRFWTLVIWCFSAFAVYKAARWGVDAYFSSMAAKAGLDGETFHAMLVRTSKGLGWKIKSIPAMLLRWSTIPRWGEGGNLLFFMVWGVVVPAGVVLRRIMFSPLKWSVAARLSFGMLAYMVLVGTHIFYNVRYLTPIMFFIPLLIILARRELKFRLAFTPSLLKWSLLTAGGLVAYLLVFSVWPFGAGLDTQAMKDFFYSPYLPPKRNLWALTGMFIFVSTVFVVLPACLVFRKQLKIRSMLAGFVLVLLGSQLCSTVVPYLSPAILEKPPAWKTWAAAFQSVIVLYCFTVWLRPRFIRGFRGWYGLFIVVFMGIYLLTPSWSKGFGELMSRKTYVRDTTLQLQKQLPENSVMMGERSSTMFVSSKMDVASLGKMQEPDVIETVVSQLQREPDRPVFIMLDPVERNCWVALQKNQDKVTLKIIGKVPLPSLGSPALMDIYIGQLFLPPGGQQMNKR